MSDLPMDGGAQADVPIDVDHVHTPDPNTSTPPVEQEPEVVEVESAEKDEKPEKGKKPKDIDTALSDALKKAQEKAKEKLAAEEGKEKGEKEDPDKAKVEEKAKETDPEPAEKVAKERGEDGKFKPKDQPRADTYPEPPSRFHESAKAEWASAPESVRAEATRAVQELERGIEKYRASAERYEAVRQYDEIARSNGRDLSQSLRKVVEVENALRQNPIAGLDAVLREIGPRKADGSPLTLFELAHSIVKQNPDQRALQQNNTIASLQSEIAQLKAAVQQTQGFVKEQQLAPGVAIMREFEKKNPRFAEVQNEVAAVLKSGLVPSHLSPAEKLDRAYKTVIYNIDGALPDAQTVPAPQTTQGAQTAAPAAKPLNPAGQKSVSGAPSAVAPTKAKTASGNTPSIDEALQRALRRAS